ncbi:tRNA pseudouridine(38-40) synthase TruA [Mangrovibacterium lignilyticum]|uniref:tRNA pseudouridine(38-40) synthase TruA n=1 Tax=Mangrovibacterium lignilyticum TaxID=2668052 RepID=UPI0013CF4E53|nr:tRNA pseudouridine(38-40) synthase TruA [Mangrovibacterium lignilyticum]
MKQRYFVELAYNGTRFHGWQIQPNAISVQGELEHALSTICREKMAVTGAGRTDTGVHANYYVAHFETEKTTLDDPSFTYKLNSFLGKDLVIYKVTKVDAEAHARFSAVSRTYHYFINQRKDPFAQELSWYFSHPLDVDLMNKACEVLFEFEDFTSFSKLHTDVKTNNCKIYKAQWTRDGFNLQFTIKADRFLRNMVRAIVGTLVSVGQGKLTIDDFRNIIEAKDRGTAGFSVPAQGLFLTDICYPETMFVRSNEGC